VSTAPTIDLELMRAAAALDADPAAAARRLAAVLEAAPGHAEARFMLAEACRRLGDTAAAEQLFESLVEAQPGSALLQLELGRTRARAGRTDAAFPALRAAIELDPGFADAWLELARAEFAVGDVAAGDRAWAAYTRLAPEVAELRAPVDALQDGRVAAAEALLRQRLALLPGDVDTLRLLADATRRQGDTREAEALLRECLRLAPGDAAARFSLAELLFERHRHAEVLPLVERLLATAPDTLAYLGLKAIALGLSERVEEALATMEAAVARHAENPSAWIQYGHLLRIVARPAEAVAAFRRALALDARAATAWWALADLKTFRFEDADVAAMESLLERLPARDAGRVSVEFALGKALGDRREHAAAFAHYARGNALKRATIAYDAAQTTAGTQQAIALATRAFFAERAGWGSARRDPIFIVGLPRSGSTLIEQILASHPAVEGTRELTDVRDVAVEIAVEAGRDGVAYPAALATLGRERIAAAAERYLATTAAHRHRDVPRFVDKMPMNFSHIALIQLMFPSASIIDARRHPLACGLSCYRELFADSNEFSYDLGEIGLYYRDYARLMEHVDDVLPGRVHRVHYERLVADPEREVRRLLDYCGLPFDAACLRFHENRRIVVTVSSEQVRRPIYTDALEEWRAYEPWLAPLRAALGDLVERYPAT
jgi:tetratricopeptide (TPR) repeat protein